MSDPTMNIFKRTLLSVLAYMMAFQPIAQLAHAAPAKLADDAVSLQIVKARPNIMFTLDNSGSMLWRYVPDYVANANHCRDAWEGNGTGGDGNYSTDPCDYNLGDLEAAEYGSVPMVSNYNGLYYDPNITYKPGRNADGTTKPSQVDATQVRIDPYSDTTTTVVNLRDEYPEIVWCVTDNPDVFPAGATASTLDPRLCRRNGVAYNAVTAPAVAPTFTYIDSAIEAKAKTPGYNYPNASEGVTNPPADARFGFRAGALWCTKANPTAAERGNTNICRRNGVSYAATNIGGVVAPAVNAAVTQLAYPTTAAVNANIRFNQRVEVSQFKILGAPYYYITDSVQFCTNQITSATAKDRGFADTTTGTCDTRWQPGNGFAQYVRFGNFKRVDIVSTAAPFEFKIKRLVGGIPLTRTRSYAEELENFANWYAYARFRMQAMKTGASIAFADLSDDERVGYHTLNSVNTNFVPVKDFDSGQKDDWFKKLFAAIPGGATPSLNAAGRVGRYFQDGKSPMDNSTISSPIESAARAGESKPAGRCQRNFHLLSTDGYWNQGNYDGDTNAEGKASNDQNAIVSGSGTVKIQEQGVTYTVKDGDAWSSVAGGQNPFFATNLVTNNDVANTATTSLSDIAAYYWGKDLNTTLADEVRPTSANPATWQHLSMYGLALGAQGRLPYLPNPNTTIKRLAGTVTPGLTWPQPDSNDPPAIDDMWRATLLSRGEYLNAQTPEQLSNQLAYAVNKFKATTATRTPVTILSPNLEVVDVVTAPFAYAYRSKSTGDGNFGELEKIKVDVATGLQIEASPAVECEIWCLGKKLSEQTAKTVGASVGWDKFRRIVTHNGDDFVPFRLNNLASSQKSALAIDQGGSKDIDTAGPILEYLRGSKQYEGVESHLLRVREGVLGDISSSEAVLVSSPRREFVDAGYAAFKTAYANRPDRVYVGANDGMLHAVNGDTGFEEWAYVPSTLYRDDATGLKALAYQQGGTPPFAHKFYVNATPRAFDVDFKNTGTSTPPTSGNDWRTILVGGLGKGGKGYFALDITDPASIAPIAVKNTGGTFDFPNPNSTSETSLAGKIKLWEFSDNGSDDIGYSYGPPIITKTYSHGWVVVLPTGYNNASGKGGIFVLNAKTGAVIKKLLTTEGSSSNPVNLAAIAGYTVDFKDHYTEQVYGGDLNGNVWRFNIKDVDVSKWTVEKFAALDKNGKKQPITALPQIEVDENSSTKERYVFVGTGQLLHPDDNKGTQSQSFYALRDGDKFNESTITAPITRATTGLAALANTSTTGVATGGDKGWYIDFDDNQRVVKNPQADAGVVVFASTSPTDDPCGSEFENLYGRTYSNGTSVLKEGTAVKAYVTKTSGASGLRLIRTTDASGKQVVKVQTTDKEGKLTTNELLDPSLVSARLRRLTIKVLDQQ